jgi:SPX domain protein involved in polyphosphate accumulation
VRSRDGQAQSASGANAAEEEALLRRAEEIYKELQDLRGFRHMNHDGFRKTLKKHDKVTQLPLMESMMPEVDRRLAAEQERELQEVRAHKESYHNRLAHTPHHTSQPPRTHPGQPPCNCNASHAAKSQGRGTARIGEPQDGGAV